jgi:hypothetical protein
VTRAALPRSGTLPLAFVAAGIMVGAKSSSKPISDQMEGATACIQNGSDALVAVNLMRRN